MIKKVLKHYKNFILNADNENKIITFAINKYVSVNHKVLDVGCGYGKNLRVLQKQGINVLGVEINESIVTENIKNGYLCCTVKDFESNTDKFDLIIMSHIIEHFTPTELLSFMEYYLCKLKKDGFLIIVTPLLSPYFYDDFDHIKPYHPTGIDMVFCSVDSQVQYRSKIKLKCADIWFRRSPLRCVFGSDIYIARKIKYSLIMNLLLAIVYRCSLGLIGQKDGWIGVYKKVN